MKNIDMIVGIAWVPIWKMDKFNDHSFSLITYDNFGIYLKVVVYVSSVAFTFAFSSPKSISYVAFYPIPTRVAVIPNPIINFGLFKYYSVSIISTTRINPDHKTIYVFSVY